MNQMLELRIDLAGLRIGIVLSGCNVDLEAFFSAPGPQNS